MSRVKEKILELHEAEPDLTQREIAERTGASYAYVMRLLPPSDRLPRFAGALDVNLCDACGDLSGQVHDSRPTENGARRRRRHCTKCGYNWTTYEMKLSPDQVFQFLALEQGENILARLPRQEREFMVRIIDLLSRSHRH